MYHRFSMLISFFFFREKRLQWGKIQAYLSHMYQKQIHFEKNKYDCFFSLPFYFYISREMVKIAGYVENE